VTPVTVACEASASAERRPAAVQTPVIAIQIANIAPFQRALKVTPGSRALSIAGSYTKTRTLAETVSLLAAGTARILSGGTDFYPAQGDRPVREMVVDVSALKELRGVSREADFFRIGGLTTWTDILAAPLPRCFDGLKSAAREVGSVQIQNRGTVAGNLCNASPAADGVPPLLTLDAQVELVSKTGTRVMPLAEFIVGNRKTQRKPDELLTAVLIPRTAEDASSSFVKLGARRYLVISIAMVAAVVATDDQGRITDVRVAVGSCSAVAQRLPGLEAALKGSSALDGFTGRIQREHVAPLSPIDDVRATGEYRMDASITLIERALNHCVQPS
jgi:CO/xanthine dehydrogenase FAD-binding subunit